MIVWEIVAVIEVRQDVAGLGAEAGAGNAVGGGRVCACGVWIVEVGLEADGGGDVVGTQWVGGIPRGRHDGCWGVGGGFIGGGGGDCCG